MRIYNIVETINDKVSQILSYPVYEEQLSEDVSETAELEFIKLINEQTHPVVLSDESQEYFLNEKVYHNGKDYRLEIVVSYTN
jgi:hypothetical protein